MTMIRRHRARSLLVCLAALGIGACSGQAASPTPGGTGQNGTPAVSARPSGAPAPPPAGSTSPEATTAPPGWSWQRAIAGALDSAQTAVGPDGTVFVAGAGPANCPIQVHAFGPAGAELEGWPFCWTRSRYLGVLEVDGTGTLYAGADGALVGINPAGAVASGWPQAVHDSAAAFAHGIVVSRSPSKLAAYDPAGRDLPGWPVTLPGDLVDSWDGAPPYLVASDGTVAALYRDTQVGRRFVTLLGPDGRPRPGWPVGVPSEMDGRSLCLDALAPDGRVILRSHEPLPGGDLPPIGLHAQVLAISPDGSIPGGWPAQFDMPLSGVIAGEDGLLYAVAGDVQYAWQGNAWTGGPYAAVALRPDGTPPPGWPVVLPAGMTPLAAESDIAGPRRPWAQPPILGDAGRVLVATGQNDSRGGLAWIGPAGTIDAVVLLPEEIGFTSGQPATGGGHPAFAPVLVGDRAVGGITITAPAARPPDGGTASSETVIRARLADTTRTNTTVEALVAIDPAGVVPGWPLLLPGSTWINGLLELPDGTVVVLALAEKAQLISAAAPFGAAAAP
jgi:hypothetical protein